MSTSDLMTDYFLDHLLPKRKVSMDDFELPYENDPSEWSLNELVEAGADPLARDSWGNPFLHLALNTLVPDLVEAVVDAQLLNADLLNHEYVCRFNLARGTDALGRTPLVILLHALLRFDQSEARRGYGVSFSAEMLTRLVNFAVGSAQHGEIRINPWGRDHSTSAQLTPMHLAIRLEDDLAVPVIKAMLELGAPRDKRDDVEGLTALEMLEAWEQREGQSEGLTRIMDALRAAPACNSEAPAWSEDDLEW